MRADDRTIELVLPHRPPMLFVERVEDIAPGVRGVGFRAVPADDPMAAPGGTFLPWLQAIEMIAQTAAIVAKLIDPVPDTPSVRAPGYLAGFNAKSHGSIHLPAELRAEVEITKNWGPLAMISGVVFADDVKVVEADVTISTSIPK
ncbi:hypothetical protein DPQ33_02160 [Oceanidesulfovibrio indonesiensis]|uniref:Uncharacterized protein n=1 Tax=Oceanidesulfovibrio indonesiensis TaxID=54767 RepID=A0A7M3MHL5_9BACT|nr:hypothetical protein [Oceanidesulfovibrio indonesiensis]TVM19184.1 hypothetical protein DPQ33_02160 [Oceanidesulfovibrio indonesiensis]